MKDTFNCRIRHSGETRQAIETLLPSGYSVMSPGVFPVFIRRLEDEDPGEKYNTAANFVQARQTVAKVIAASPSRTAVISLID